MLEVTMTTQIESSTATNAQRVVRGPEQATDVESRLSVQWVYSGDSIVEADNRLKDREYK